MAVRAENFQVVLLIIGEATIQMVDLKRGFPSYRVNFPHPHFEHWWSYLSNRYRWMWPERDVDPFIPFSRPSVHLRMKDW